MRSLAWPRPTTSSSPSPMTGSRLKPCSMAMSSAPLTVASWGMVTMSGRGTITSRATVSPNSMIDSMSSRSSRSITVVLGRGLHDAEQLLLRDERALLQPLPRQQDVGQADERPGDELQRREADQRRRRPGADQGRPLGVQHGVRLGHRLGQHEEHDHVQDEGDDEPDGAEEAVGQDRGQEGLRGLADGDGDEQGVDEPLGVVGQPGQLPGRAGARRSRRWPGP